MRIGINLHPLQNMGGAEYVMLAMASALSLRHDVELLTVGRLEPARAETFFGLDLSRVRVRSLADGEGPARRWLDAALARLPEGNRYKKLYASAVGARRTAAYDLFINGESGDLIPCRAPGGILYVFFPWRWAELDRGDGMLQDLYLAPYRRWHRRHDPAGVASTYSLVVTSSDYVRRHIAGRWGCEARVLRPPVAVDRYTAGRKAPAILAVGRFFLGGHVKKHEVMVDVFRRLRARGRVEWTLHLAGGLFGARRNFEYARRLQSLAADLPVRFHFNIPGPELARLFGEASLFWHAAGYGEDLDRHPERAEHFGITTVEAMAAGAVPLAYAAGGQPEVVEDGVSGRLWRTPEELLEQTEALAGDPAGWERLAAGARRRSEAFRFERFAAELERLVAQVMEGGRPQPS